ncbi:MAG: hypothetical protein HKM04_09025 [Legionellales bacterium]|nr:hypothetical protein [Legionellales bacterium]
MRIGQIKNNIRISHGLTENEHDYFSRLERCSWKARKYLTDDNLSDREEFQYFLSLFDELLINARERKLSNITVRHEIKKMLKLRWKLMSKSDQLPIKLSLLNYTWDRHTGRKAFFFQIASLVASDTESIVSVLMPGIKEIVPDLYPYEENFDSRMISNTEKQEKSGLRQIYDSIIYGMDEQGNERLLEVSEIFSHAMKDDAIFFTDRSSNNIVLNEDYPISLSPTEKEIIATLYPVLFNLFKKNYLLKDNVVFNTKFNKLILAVYEASTKKPGNEQNELLALFSEEGVKNITEFYHYWRALDPDIRACYENQVCTNGNKLGDNLIRVFSGTLTNRNILTDLKITVPHYNAAQSIHPCMHLMHTALSAMQEKFSQEVSGIKLKGLLKKFNWEKKKLPRFSQYNSDIAAVCYYGLNHKQTLERVFLKYYVKNTQNWTQDALVSRLKNQLAKVLAGSAGDLPPVHHLPTLRLLEKLFPEEISAFFPQEASKLVNLFSSYRGIQKINTFNTLAYFMGSSDFQEELIAQLITQGYVLELLEIGSIHFKSITLNNHDLPNDMLLKNKQAFTLFFYRSLQKYPKHLNAIDATIVLMKQKAEGKFDAFREAILYNLISVQIINSFGGLAIVFDFLSEKEKKDFCEIIGRVAEQRSSRSSYSPYFIEPDTSRSLEVILVLGCALYYPLATCMFIGILCLAIPSSVIYTGGFFASILAYSVGLFCFCLPLIICCAIGAPMIARCFGLSKESVVRAMMSVSQAGCNLLDLLSFHPNKNNLDDFWCSRESRYQLSFEDKLFNSMSKPVKKTVRNIIHAIQPYHQPFSLTKEVKKAFFSPVNGVLNIGKGVIKILPGSLMVLSSSAGQMLAVNSRIISKYIAKKAFQRTGILMVAGATQASYGVFQIGSWPCYLFIVPFRFIRAKLEDSATLLEANSKIKKTQSECFAIINEINKENNINEISSVTFIDSDEESISFVVQQPKKTVEPSPTPFILLAKQLNKAVEKKSCNKDDYTYLRKLSFLNTTKKLQLNPYAIREISQELSQLQVQGIGSNFGV